MEDRWIIALTHVIIGGPQAMGEYGKGVNQLLEDFQIGEAGQRLYGFFWHSFCDWYIELAKLRLRAGDLTPLPILASVLDTSLRLLHPFMPFVTEAVWQNLRVYLRWADTDALITASWPVYDQQMEQHFWATRNAVNAIQGAVHFVGEARTIHGVPATQTLEKVLVGPNRKMLDEYSSEARELEEKLRTVSDARKRARLETALAMAQHSVQTHGVMLSAIADHQDLICSMARVKTLEIHDDLRPLWSEKEKYAFGPLEDRLGLYVALALPLAGLIDVEAERARLSKQLAEAEAEVKRLEGKLANPAFREKAPAAVVAGEEEKLAAVRARLEGLRQRLAELE